MRALLRLHRRFGDWLNESIIPSTPIGFRRLHGWLAVLWTMMMPISLLAGWVQSVVFVSVLSIYALAAAHFSAWQSTRVEVKQDEADNERDAAALARLDTKLDTLTAKVDRLLAQRAGSAGPRS